MAKILLAEDDLFLRDIYLEILKDEGYSVTPAVDGEQALMELKKGGWDLVLLDVVMPKMSGADVLRNMEKTKVSALAKHIVFMTNTDETKNIADVKDMTDGYLLKSSFDPEQLIKKIKEFLK
jgi:CheY-like chemotaxis protein